MNRDTITKLRLYNQHIVHSGLKNPADVVARLGAMQAQDYPGALWSIGLRLPSATKADVDIAIAKRQIVRTWPMRGTLHFVPAEDVRWMLELMTPRVISSAAHRVRNLELNDAIFEQARHLFAKKLQGGKVLPRSGMNALLEEVGISTKGQRGIHIMWRLSQEGLLCFGPHEGKEPTFTLLSEWIPNAKSMPRDESIAKIALRYFTSHGPTTVRDFMWWTGLTSKDAKIGLEASKNQLVSENFDGALYWMPKNQRDSSSERTAFLLPGFDEYMLGYRDRSAALDTEHGQKIVPGNNGMFLATIVINGKIEGLWKKKPLSKSMTLSALPFAKITPRDHVLLRRAADHYGEFIGTHITLS